MEISQSNKEYLLNDIKVGERVNHIRELHQLNQDDFLDRLGENAFSKSLLSEIENGNKALTLKSALLIANAFNVSLDYLYCRSDDTKDNASQIIDVLQRIMKIDFLNNTMEISKPLEKLLSDICNLDKTKKDNENMPELAYNSWLNAIKDEYNETVKSETITKESVKYKFVEYSEYNKMQKQAALTDLDKLKYTQR
jgi:transcriptional regulator with XRE-family HTH domain